MEPRIFMCVRGLYCISHLEHKHQPFIFREEHPMTPSETLDPLDNLGPPFNPSLPRYKQKFDVFHVRYVRHGLNKAFSEACRRHGYRNYWVIEKLVEHFLRTGELPRYE